MWSRSSRTSSKEKKQFSSAQEAYDCALNLLSYRDYSEKKMLERLQQKGADEEQSQQALEKLQHYGLVDDERYAARVYEGWLAKRCYGRQHLKAELSKRGVGAELIAELMERFTPELEADSAHNRKPPVVALALATCVCCSTGCIGKAVARCEFFA